MSSRSNKAAFYVVGVELAWSFQSAEFEVSLNDWMLSLGEVHQRHKDSRVFILWKDFFYWLYNTVLINLKFSRRSGWLQWRNSFLYNSLLRECFVLIGVFVLIGKFTKKYNGLSWIFTTLYCNEKRFFNSKFSHFEMHY